MVSTAECPLCDQPLEGMDGWEHTPETAIARHLQSVHPGWEARLGYLAEVLNTLDATDTTNRTGRPKGDTASNF